MPRAMFSRAVASALLLANATPAFAQELQGWAFFNLNMPVAADWRATVEVNARTQSGPSSGQLLGRVLLARPVAKDVRLGGGLVLAHVHPADRPWTTDKQVFGQLNWDVADAGPVRIEARTRLELRFQEGAGRPNWRLREQVRLSWPLGPNGVRMIVSTEPFVNLNRTRRVRQDFDQLRNFIGLSVPVSRHSRLDLGYMGQYFHRPSGDAWISTLPVTVSVRL
jgi:hypothetical protein